MTHAHEVEVAVAVEVEAEEWERLHGPDPIHSFFVFFLIRFYSLGTNSFHESSYAVRSIIYSNSLSRNTNNGNNADFLYGMQRKQG